MKLDKKAIIGEGIINIYRILLVILIALVVLGTSAIFYGYYLDVRNVEAEILSKQIIECLNSKILDINNFDYLKYQNKFLDYCDIKNTERFYVKIRIVPFSGDEEKIFEQGDSGAGWVKDVLKSGNYENLEKYEPGYFSETYLVNIISSGKKIRALVSIEVIVAHEL